MKILQVIFVTFLWASILLISKAVDLPSPVFVFFRVFFSLAVVIPLALKEGIEKPRLSLILSGILVSLNWIFLFLAVRIIGPSTADFIYYSAPIISMFLSGFFGEKIPLSSWIAVLISFTGVGLIFSFSPSNPVGMLYAFLGAVFYGSVVVMGRFIRSGASSITFYQMVMAILLTFPFTLTMDYSLDFKKIVLLLIAGVLNTGIALVLWWDALKKLGIKTASVLTYLDPLFAFILSIVFFNYKPSISEIAGGFLVITGGVLVSLREIKKAPAGGAPNQ
jgi:drug/metabolite transporter (DMT)-like permease